MKNRRNTPDSHRLNAERLRAMSELGDHLAAADDPISALEKFIPRLMDQLSAACEGSILDPFEIIASNPAPPSWTLQIPVMVRDASREMVERPVAIMGVRRLGGAEALSDLALGSTDHAYIDSAVQLAGYYCTLASFRDELARRDRVAQDLVLATELQRSLQPGFDPEMLPIWGVNLPARQVSGDFFDFYANDEGDYVFALGDVSGKGMSAALFMAKTIGLFRCLSKRIASPAELLSAINTELCETASRGMFVTMVAGCYSPRNGRVQFANAGHEPPLLRRKNRTYETFPADAPPLGILSDNSFRDEEIVLEGGEFYVFSDGLTEYRYASGEQLGVEGLIQIVEAYADVPPAKRLEAVIRMLDEDSGWEARDDLTAIAIDDSWVAAGETSVKEAG